MIKTENKIFEYKDNLRYIHHTRTDEPKQSEFFSHFHSMNEIFYLYEGRGKFAVEGNIYDLAPGTVIITPGGQTHHIILDGDCNIYERAALLFEKNVFPSLAVTHCRAFKLSGTEKSALETGIGILEKSGLITSAFDGISALILSYAESTDITNENNATDSAVSAAVQYINSHLTEKLSLELISKAVYLNKAVLNRKFKSVIGCSVWEYTVKKRIFASRQKLYFTGSVAAAFEYSGFTDYSSFFRAYKKCFGISPSEDIKSLNG